MKAFANKYPRWFSGNYFVYKEKKNNLSIGQFVNYRFEKYFIFLKQVIENKLFAIASVNKNSSPRFSMPETIVPT